MRKETVIGGLAGGVTFVALVSSIAYDRGRADERGKSSQVSRDARGTTLYVARPPDGEKAGYQLTRLSPTQVIVTPAPDEAAPEEIGGALRRGLVELAGDGCGDSPPERHETKVKVSGDVYTGIVTLIKPTTSDCLNRSPDRLPWGN